MDEYLRTAVRARGWTIPQFAEACEVATGLAQKWLSVNPRYRAMPGPASCQKIADALNVDPDYLLQLAGHRRPRNGHAGPEPADLRLQHINRIWPTLDELLRSVLYDIAERHSNGNVIQPSGPIYGHLIVAA